MQGEREARSSSARAQEIKRKIYMKEAEGRRKHLLYNLLMFHRARECTVKKKEKKITRDGIL